MTKLRQVLNLIEKILGDLNPVVRVMEHYVNVESGIEYINMRVMFSQPSAVLVIRQYWRRGVLMAYGYYIRFRDYEEWWDNRPHHPEVPSHPHHRHVENKIQPLSDPSLENFLARAKELLGRK